MRSTYNLPALTAYSDRVAFLLNANAKRVNDTTLSRLLDVVPAGDLFYCKNEADSVQFLRTIIRRGYKTVFCGGGDGTLVHTLHRLRQLVGKHPSAQMPRLGVLKLGTGNAMAHWLGASKPISDAHHLAQGGNFAVQSVPMVECDGDIWAPMAGIGYDGELLNDYIALRKSATSKFKQRLMTSVFGYLWAAITRTVPRRLKSEWPLVRITSKGPAFRVVHEQGVDSLVEVPAGTVLFEGRAPTVSVGTMPFYGYGFCMFPFARLRSGFMQLRVCAVSIPTILKNVFPGIWRGTFRHPNLHDFLVKDIVVESESPMPYQVAGDACGFKKQIEFKVSEQQLEMVQLPIHRLPLQQNATRKNFNLQPSGMSVEA